MKWLVVGILGVVLVGGVAWEAKLLANKQEKVVKAAQENLPVAAEPTQWEASQTYSSSTLGIRFKYAANIDGQNVLVKEAESKVYVYMEGTAPEAGQYVEVMSKPPTDSLQRAIQKQILAKYSPADCLVVGNRNNWYGSNFESQEIRVPTGSADGMEEELTAKWNKCPAPYTATNGIAYFLMQKDRPGKMLFFSIGQYMIGDGAGKTWQQTIRVY